MSKNYLDEFVQQRKDSIFMLSLNLDSFVLRNAEYHTAAKKLNAEDSEANDDALSQAIKARDESTEAIVRNLEQIFGIYYTVQRD